MKQVKALIGLFVVVAAFYVAFKLMPPYYNQMQFQDAVEQEARKQSYAYGKTEDDIRTLVMQHAQTNDIPVTPEQVHVTRAGTEVDIEVDYTVHIDLPIYPLDLKFHAGSKNKAM
jgi:hypothetical protein